MRLDKGITEDTVKGWVHDVFKRLRAWSYAPVQNALGVHGIPDRLACVPIKVTPEMVGMTIGVFAAVECKRPGRRGEKNAGHKGTQVTQLRDILTAHGIAMTVDCKADVDKLSRVIEVIPQGCSALNGALVHTLETRIMGRDK